QGNCGHRCKQDSPKHVIAPYACLIVATTGKNFYRGGKASTRRAGWPNHRRTLSARLVPPSLSILIKAGFRFQEKICSFRVNPDRVFTSIAAVIVAPDASSY
ncbi:MAG: hypothetical protein WEA31_03475, partial [Pirellulales bacterium]